MPTTKIDVYNRALACLGQISGQEVETDAEDTANANTLNRFYAQSLDAFLEEAWWSWATRYEVLSLDSATPPENWRYAYKFPKDCVAPRYIVGDAPEERVEFEEGVDANGLSVIWSDRQYAELQYTARVDDFNAWGGAAVNAFALKLAMDAAPAFTGDTAQRRELQGDYEFALEKAMDASHNRHQLRMEDHNETIDARHGRMPSDRYSRRYIQQS